jgi:hypothetical protein
MRSANDPIPRHPASSIVRRSTAEGLPISASARCLRSFDALRMRGSSPSRSIPDASPFNSVKRRYRRAVV